MNKTGEVWKQQTTTKGERSQSSSRRSYVLNVAVVDSRGHGFFYKEEIGQKCLHQ
jgi:hypothetical protein